MDWAKAKVIHTENNRHQLWIMEAIQIWKQAQMMMNQDKGAFMLSLTWNTILKELLDSKRCSQPVKLDRTTTPQEYKLTRHTHFTIM